MARISVERAHDLGREAAKQKAEILVKKLAEKYSVEPKWSGDTVKLAGSGVSGTVSVFDEWIKVEVEVGFLMSAFSGTIKSEIEKALDKVLV
ncbi:polyhydroxyalkanoic acid system family protein [Pseudomonas sp. 10B1]|uniref:polyhydroxyalkanoic acid system family protein n=1 Tax=unclassified Pseudomonas TaxID=196821 RepID=UPI002AB430DC|nr:MULTISPECIES: polyhydroxyalkanoic acid system family protein [unclassified Pseudomonas]MDY7562963.1 polyhydroxyalkanoic acid system family protein [Pseudomonas sp. AB6]MEA9978660.1 polyhydroxyalkanoic acid system family protein [Pseudomonas sp. RTS4]MEA9995450.1 polyhydroxyalkanoic acid system family protein [Pseudomonas sp. AA4]MEB0085294.1 polyhydroxyalkanoic acid system family protein [Pseudomonas sp. RTI1]MEB0125397.1 polyhydroxyalkanoic acid system family protein [Pseudomonas sp. CCC1.